VKDHLDRSDLHIPSIDEDLARRGECGRVHLPTGDACTLDQHHAGSCRFVILDEAPGRG